MKRRVMVARVECVLVPHSARLASVKKEWHTRKRRGREVAYIAISRDRSWALLSQKLSLLSEWINSNLTEGEPCSKVSTNGLYENVDCTDGRAGGWHKGIWRITSVDLERVCDTFEKVLGGCVNAAVVASQPECYECVTVQ